MAVWSIVNYKNTKSTNRIDSEYYQPEYIQFEKTINKWGNLFRLKEIAEVRGGKRLPKGETFSEVGIPYVRSIDMESVFIDFDKVCNIPMDVHNILKKYKLKHKDILITIVGSVGLIGYMQKDLSPCNFTENCAVIRSKAMSPELLLAFFLSKIGQCQINREKVGTIKDKLSLERLRNVLVPQIKTKNLENDVVNLVNLSSNYYEISKTQYFQAEKILIEALGLKDMDFRDELFYTTTLGEIKENNRMDAEYYIPKYEKFMKHLYKYKNANLSYLSKIKKGIEPGRDSYLNTGKRFIRVSNLTKFGINNNNQKYLGVDLYEHLKGLHEPLKGEILLSKDATPGIAYVLKEPAEGIVSSGILRLEVEQVINKEYLALVINSPIGQLQMKRDSGGSIIDHWKIEEIKNIKIPLLPNSIQEEIEKLCYESFLKMKQAKQFLEEAKLKVEKMIEKEVG